MNPLCFFGTSYVKGKERDTGWLPASKRLEVKGESAFLRISGQISSDLEMGQEVTIHVGLWALSL